MKERRWAQTAVRSFFISLFIFAGNMLSVGKDNPFELVPAAFAGGLALLAAALAAERMFGERERRGAERIFFILLSLVVAVAAFYVAAESVSELSAFVGGVMLLRLPEFLVAAVFVALCACLAGSGFGTVKKFSYVAFLIVSLSATLLLLLSTGSFKWERATGLWEMLSETSALGVARALAQTFAPAVLAVIYMAASEQSGRDKSPLFGALIAATLFLVCFFNVFLILGGSLGASEDYPYATAVSTVTAGKLFARMEGFAYIMYCAAGVIRVSVCIALISRLAEKITNRSYPCLPWAVSLALLPVTLIFPAA